MEPVARIEWLDDELEPPAGFAGIAVTVDELDAVLDLVAAACEEHAVMVNVYRRNGDALAIGLGNPIVLEHDGDDGKPMLCGLTVLSFVAADGDPPYFTTVSPAPRLHAIAFIAGGWTEFPGNAAVSIELARSAMREFISGTGLPGAVDWQEV